MRTRGFTLVETMVVIVVIAVVLVYGYPKIRATMIKNSLRSARSATLTAIQRAKTVAVTEGRAATVRLDPATGNLWITASPRRSFLAGSPWDTVGSIKNLTAAYGTTVLTNGQDTLAFDARGMMTPIGSSTPQIIAMTKSSYRDSVMINGYGRITK